MFRLKLFSVFVFCFCSCDSFFISKTSETLKQDTIQADSSTLFFISENNLGAVLSEEYYQIKAHFPSSDTHLNLFSHFSGFQWEDGVKLSLKRQGDALLIKISAPSYPEKILFQQEDYFSSSNEVDLTIAVENGTNYGFRVRVWENFINKNGILKEPREFLSDENLLADSLLEQMSFYSKGQGLKWGIKSFRVNLIKGERVSPRLL